MYTRVWDPRILEVDGAVLVALPKPSALTPRVLPSCPLPALSISSPTYDVYNVVSCFPLSIRWSTFPHFKSFVHIVLQRKLALQDLGRVLYKIHCTKLRMYRK